MHRESWKIFLACAIGAGIGSLVALEMHPMLWWVGLIVGFATGYLSYEWRAVVRAVPEAWRAARGWTLPPRYWDRLVWSLACWLNTILITCTIIVGSILLLDGRTSMDTAIPVLQLMILFFFLLALFLCPLHFMQPDQRDASLANASVDSLKQTAIFTFLPVIAFFVLPRGIWWCVRRIPMGIGLAAYGTMTFARFLRAFAWLIFLRIHSELRLLCGVDAMLGTIVGFHTGSALVGACIGGAFGVLNYAVVTKRILEPRGYLLIRS